MEGFEDMFARVLGGAFGWWLQIYRDKANWPSLLHILLVRGRAQFHVAVVGAADVDVQRREVLRRIPAFSHGALCGVLHRA